MGDLQTTKTKKKHVRRHMVREMKVIFMQEFISENNLVYKDYLPIKNSVLTLCYQVKMGLGMFKIWKQNILHTAEQVLVLVSLGKDRNSG